MNPSFDTNATIRRLSEIRRRFVEAGFLAGEGPGNASKMPSDLDAFLLDEFAHSVGRTRLWVRNAKHRERLRILLESESGPTATSIAFVENETVDPLDSTLLVVTESYQEAFTRGVPDILVAFVDRPGIFHVKSLTQAPIPPDWTVIDFGRLHGSLHRSRLLVFVGPALLDRVQAAVKSITDLFNDADLDPLILVERYSELMDRLNLLEQQPAPAAATAVAAAPEPAPEPPVLSARNGTSRLLDHLGLREPLRRFEQTVLRPFFRWISTGVGGHPR
jgi:hypothetical protein